jgi:hypothetical protein
MPDGTNPAGRPPRIDVCRDACFRDGTASDEPDVGYTRCSTRKHARPNRIEPLDRTDAALFAMNAPHG